MKCWFRCKGTKHLKGANCISPPYQVKVESSSGSKTCIDSDTHRLDNHDNCECDPNQRQLFKVSSMSSWYRTRNKSYQQETLDSNFEEMVKEADFINPETFSKANINEKLTTLMTSLNKLHRKFDTINDDLSKEADGIVPKLDKQREDLDTVLEETDILKFEVCILRGVVHKQEKQISSLTERVNDLVMRSMSDNIVITGLPIQKVEQTEDQQSDESNKEDCHRIVKEFFENKIGIEVDENQILVAHRIGQEDSDREPLMVV